MDCLNRWKGNNKQLKSLFESASQLKAVEAHSKNLAALAEIGIDALSKLKNGTTPDATWINEELATLKAMNKPYAETELCIIPEIEALVKQQLSPLPASYSLF